MLYANAEQWVGVCSAEKTSTMFTVQLMALQGLVHRYLVYAQQNARRVSLGSLGCLPCSLLRHWPRNLQGRSVVLLYKAQQAVTACLQGTASTLTRGEVRGGGRKPYKQKGSGNARRGSKRSPLMPGGAISFGPKVGVGNRVTAAGQVVIC